MSDTVRAAGGVVVRTGADGGVEVLLVHRPKYGDWTLPKGKCLPGESDLDCAIREVQEETGLRCKPDTELPSTSYFDSRRRPKVVRYWLMEPTDGHFEPHKEVDAVQWLALEHAGKVLTYERDLAVLAAVP